MVLLVSDQAMTALSSLVPPSKCCIVSTDLGLPQFKCYLSGASTGPDTAQPGCCVTSLHRSWHGSHHRQCVEVSIGPAMWLSQQNSVMQALGAEPDIYDKLTASLAPSIWQMEDVKKGVLCQLFGGTTKVSLEAGRQHQARPH